jgi:hypothetical protein
VELITHPILKYLAAAVAYKCPTNQELDVYCCESTNVARKKIYAKRCVAVRDLYDVSVTWTMDISVLDLFHGYPWLYP